jgi:phosphoribosylformylglycinamidine synthase
MDLKSPGNLLYQIGRTKAELAGSHFELVTGASAGNLPGAGNVPQVDVETAKRTFAALHQAIQAGHVRACHDLSEGGLSVALAEMAFAGGCGARVRLAEVPHDGSADSRSPEADAVLLFSESASRFVIEVPPAKRGPLEMLFRQAQVPLAHFGEVTETSRLQIAASPHAGHEPPATWLIDLPIADLKEAWQKPLRW